MTAAAAAAPAIAFTLRWFLSSASTSAAASEAFFCAATRIAPRDLLAERRTRRPAWKEREEEESNAGQRCRRASNANVSRETPGSAHPMHVDRRR
jgi:hypothetical protein